MLILEILTLITVIILICLSIITPGRIKNMLNNNKYNISFKKAYKLSKIPLIEIENFENQKIEPVAFLVDSGANTNFISKEFLEQFKPDFKKYIRYSDDVMSINGTMVLNQALQLNLNYNNTTLTDSFVVTENNPTFEYLSNEYGKKVVGIIGSELMRKYNFNIDFENLKIQFDK